MSNLTKIFVVRHGQSSFNATENIESYAHDGELGSPLTEKGIEQARKVAQKLKKLEFAAILSSDMNRTRETAEVIAKEEKLRVATNSTIRERSIFDYLNMLNELKKDGLEDLTEEMLRDLAKLDEKSKMKYKHTHAMESAEEGALRLLNYIIKAEEKYHGKTILLVSHGNIMRSLLNHLGWAKFDELPVGSIENTGYFVLESDGKNFRVMDTSGIHKQKGTLRNY